MNGLKETAVQDSLMSYDTSMSFARALGKHYKIFNVCDTTNIKACYNVEEVTINKEGETLAVSKIKKAKNLSLKEEDGWLDPVTIVATDGTVFIMSYNKNCAITEAEIQGIKDENGKYSDSNEALSCINGVLDINGVSAPNVQGKDILPFNGTTVGLTKSAPFYSWNTITSRGKTLKISNRLTPEELRTLS